MKSMYVVYNVWLNYDYIVGVCDDLRIAAEMVYRMEKEMGFDVDEPFEEYYEKKMWNIDSPIREYKLNVYYKE